MPNDLLSEAIERLSKYADAHHDGHFTIMRFTTGWKVMFGTPDMSLRWRRGLDRAPGSMSLDDALSAPLPNGDDERPHILDEYIAAGGR